MPKPTATDALRLVLRAAQDLQGAYIPIKPEGLLTIISGREGHDTAEAVREYLVEAGIAQPLPQR